MTRQVEYRGDVVALTEALVGFPSGGQVLMSGSTYQRVYGNLHTVQLDDHLLTKLNKLSSKKAAAGIEQRLQVRGYSLAVRGKMLHLPACVWQLARNAAGRPSVD